MEVFPHPQPFKSVHALKRTVEGDVSVLFVVSSTFPRLEASATIWGVETDTPRLADVFVPAPHRRKRHGTALVQAATEWAERQGLPLYLHVAPENGPARALYESLGWTYTGAERDSGDLWMAAPHVTNIPANEIENV